MAEPTRGDRTRAAIVRAATDHLVRHRLEGLRGRDVGEDAGVSEASVWFHFGTKSGLLVAVMQTYYDELVRDLERVVDDASSPRDRLTAFARFWFERMSRDLVLVGELGRHGRFGPDGDVVAAFAACNRRVTRLFERVVEDLAASGALRDDVAPRLLRDAFFGTAEHMIVGRAVAGRAGTVDDDATALLDVVLRGIGPGRDDAGPSLAGIDAKLDRLLTATADAGDHGRSGGSRSNPRR